MRNTMRMMHRANNRDADAHKSLSFTYSEFKRSIEADKMDLYVVRFLPVPASMGKL